MYKAKIEFDNCQLTSLIDHNSVKKITLAFPREYMSKAKKNSARSALC